MAMIRLQNRPAAQRSRDPASPWTPRVDIRELPDKYVLLADVPGVDPGDLSITTQGDVLSVAGTRESDEEAAGGRGYRRRERARGSFERRFSLPEAADAARITARAHAGVLSIEIPKAERALARRIEVTH